MDPWPAWEATGAFWKRAVEIPRVWPPGLYGRYERSTGAQQGWPRPAQGAKRESEESTKPLVPLPAINRAPRSYPWVGFPPTTNPLGSSLRVLAFEEPPKHQQLSSTDLPNATDGSAPSLGASPPSSPRDFTQPAEPFYSFSAPDLQTQTQN